MEIKIGDIATFDNPDNIWCRWGKVLKIEGEKVQLAYIGWGLKSEIQAVKTEVK
ncbi:hypothetical protein [Tepidanaerobacter syntrophicus]|uniref:Uncharacterized protein n=1 Tax=Tepidanaerobacter syntrophicus TaxID=224999 RepID=A0A0U9HC14_9FIRM|nr:hypothetical protein [Tepidanaerobacter syntrophicus]GAQ24238.1 hypothetical protein TSYNT_564 [Tepidanaerobacter syntrophicus]